MKLHLQICVLICLAIVCVPAVAADVYDMYFPQDLAGFKLNSVVNDEKDVPGQGFALLYDHLGVKASVFVYNLKLKDIPGGAKSAIVRKEYQQAISDVKTVHPDAQDLDATSQLSINGITMLHAAFQYASVQAGSRDVVFSHVYMTGQNGYFILVRTTYSAIDQPALGLRIEAHFIEALCNALSASKVSK